MDIKRKKVTYRWVTVGRLIEMLDKNKKWMCIRKYVANKIMEEISHNYR